MRAYAEAIRETAASNMPVGKRVLRADDFLPEKDWRVLASAGYMGDDPYTGAPGVTQVDERAYEVTTRLATRKASSRITFTFRLMESLEKTRLIFSPLLVRFLSGDDHTTRRSRSPTPGRIRNELQTMLPQALEYDGERIRVHFDRIDDKVMPPEKQAAIRTGARVVQVQSPGLVLLARGSLTVRAPIRGHLLRWLGVPSLRRGRATPRSGTPRRLASDPFSTPCGDVNR